MSLVCLTFYRGVPASGAYATELCYSDNFFLLSVLAHLEKKKDLNTIHGGLGALGDIIFIWARRMDQN